MKSLVTALVLLLTAPSVLASIDVHCGEAHFVARDSAATDVVLIPSGISITLKTRKGVVSAVLKHGSTSEILRDIVVLKLNADHNEARELMKSFDPSLDWRRVAWINDMRAERADGTGVKLTSMLDKNNAILATMVGIDWDFGICR